MSLVTIVTRPDFFCHHHTIKKRGPEASFISFSTLSTLWIAFRLLSLYSADIFLRVDH